MMKIRLVVLLAAMAFTNGHGHGVPEPELEGTKLASEHRQETRLLRGEKESDMKNLATGGNVNNKQKEKEGGGNGGTDYAPIYREPSTGNGATNGNGASAASDTAIVLEETQPCIPFNGDISSRASLSLTDSVCTTNECSGGCCRVYNWLICDTTNQMPTLACVCNENTQPPPTSAPIAVVSAPITPVTSAPIIPVTSAPVITVTSAPIPVATPNPTLAPAPVSTTQGTTNSKSYPLPTTSSNPAPASSGPVVTKPPNIGGAPPDHCASGSSLHSNPLFKDFTKCFSASDCPSVNECCIHAFCFCGQPDTWYGDCVAPTSG